jgi:hypothetical protein
MGSTSERIGVGFAILIASVFAYAIFPALQSLVVPDAPLLWEPVVSGGKAVAMIGSLIGIGLLLAMVNRLRFARATGNPVVPVLVWVLLVGVIAAVLAAFVAVVIFEATYQSMLGLGVNSSVALIVGLIVSAGTWLVLSRK